MTGRYKIQFNSWRVFEPEKRTARRWSLFVNTCRLLARDGLDYGVTFALNGDDPHILIRASGKVTRKRSLTVARRAMVPPVIAEQCALRAQEAEWFLPENAAKRNTTTTHWRRYSARYAELNALADEHLRAEVEFWRELELLSGQRQHYKPGMTGEMVSADDEVAA
jgi:hypothetical protein